MIDRKMIGRLPKSKSSATSSNIDFFLQINYKFHEQRHGMSYNIDLWTKTVSKIKEEQND